MENFNEQNTIQEDLNQVWSDGVVIKNFEALDTTQPVNLIFTFCPLYNPGTLNESKLQTEDISIFTSRVANKWAGLCSVITQLQESLKQSGSGLGTIQIYFADKGILQGFSSEQDEIQVRNLDQHIAAYNIAVKQLQQKLGVTINLSSFSALGIKFPQFVNPTAPLPEELQAVITEDSAPQNCLVDALVEYFKVHPENHTIDIVNNKKSRIVAKDLIASFGFNSAFWITAGYLAFDGLIPSLAGNNCAYIITERFEALMRVVKFTESVHKMPRIEIKC